MSPLARICGTCGKLIQQGTHHRHTTPSEQRKNQRPNAVGVYQTERWRRLRSLVLNRDDHTCQACGVHGPSSGIRLSVHHLERFTDPSDTRAFDPANMTTLCQHCHGQQHGGAH